MRVRWGEVGEREKERERWGRKRENKRNMRNEERHRDEEGTRDGGRKREKKIRTFMNCKLELNCHDLFVFIAVVYR